MTPVDNIPGWVLFHVPHNSLSIPDDVRDQFILDDASLQTELVTMTDHLTKELYCDRIALSQVIEASVSRLVVDVERFEDDKHEAMAERGMGAVYKMTSNLSPLRRPISPSERDTLIKKYYKTHHEKLSTTTDDVLSNHGRALIIDCHSFPSKKLPYELDEENVDRPDICIGTDFFHTPYFLEHAFVKAFESFGFSVGVNSPFSGAIVPLKHYQKDNQVESIMLETNRRLYLNEATGEKSDNFANVKKNIELVVQTVLTNSIYSEFAGYFSDEEDE